MANTKRTTPKKKDDKYTWKKGDVQVYKNLDDFKKKNPNAKIKRP